MTTSSSLLRAVHQLRDRISDPRSDVDLLQRYAQDHDQDAFAALVRRHGGLVFNVARRQLGDWHHVEDVFQATFLALARSSAQLGELRSLTDWLYTVALRQARKTKQRETRRTEFDQARTPPSPGPTDPLEVISGRELVSSIDEELERLPENYRAVLLLCCIEGLSREEAADRLGWTMGAVKGRLERGRRRLADQLEKKGITPSALFLEPFSYVIPESLMNRAVALAGSPWAKSIPTSVVELLSLPSSSKLLPVVALCCTLAAVGMTMFLLQPGPGESASTRATEPVRADADPLTDSLPERALRRFGSARYRHGAAIWGMTVSRDDKFAVAWMRNRACVYDLRDGRRLMTLLQGDRAIEAVALSPDGKTMAIKREGALHLHHFRTGVEFAKIPVQMGLVIEGTRSVTYWLTFSPDGSKVALSTLHRGVQIIDLETERMLNEFRFTRTLQEGVFSPDGKLFAGIDYDYKKPGYRVRLWDIDTGKEVRQIRSSDTRLSMLSFHEGWCLSGSLAFSPDGKTIATSGGGGDGRLRLLDVATGKVRHEFEKAGNYIRSVAYSHDGKTIAAAGDTIRLYDATTKKERLRIPRRASALHFSASDEVLTAAVDATIHRWDTKTGAFLTPQGCDSKVGQIGLAQNGRTLVTRDRSGVVQLWDRATGKRLVRSKMDKRREFAVSPDGRYLLLSEADPSIKYDDKVQGMWDLVGTKLKLFDLETRRYIDRFAGFEGYSDGKQFTRDGKSLVIVDRRNGKMRLWDVATGKLRRTSTVLHQNELKVWYAVTDSILSPNGGTLAVASRGHRGVVALRLWDVTTGKELDELEGHDNDISGLAFSPDGRFLASCAPHPTGARRKPNEFFIWDMKTRRRLVRLSDRESTPACKVAFSSDGRTLASASLDGTVHVWEVASWTLRTKFQAHRDPISALHVAPDGTLFTSSIDATVLAWNVRPDKPVTDMPLSTAWAKLLDPDAKTAYAAGGRMLATPKETVSFLAKQLRPVPRVDAKRVAKLLADLDSDTFTTREQAATAVRELGHQIEPALRELSTKTSSAEVRRRVRALLSELEPTVAPPAQLRLSRAVEVLDWLATPSARTLLIELAKGDPNALLTRTAASAVQRLRARRE